MLKKYNTLLKKEDYGSLKLKWLWTAEMDEIIALSFPSIVILKGWSTGWKNKIISQIDSGQLFF